MKLNAVIIMFVPCQVGLLIALSGFSFDMVKKTMEFHPVINQDDFRTFWSTGKAWGVYTQKRDASTGQMLQNTKVLYGNLDGTSINDKP